MKTDIVYILCGRGNNPETAKWLTDNSKIILATPDNGIGSNKSCGQARINVKKHAEQNGFKQYYMLDDDIKGWREPKGKPRKFDPLEIDWGDIAYGGFVHNAFINLHINEKLWTFNAPPFSAYYYNFDLINSNLTFLSDIGREDTDFYLQCKNNNLKVCCFKKLAPITQSDVFNGKSIAIPKDKMNQMHYEIYCKWGDNLKLKRDKKYPDYVHCLINIKDNIKPITYKYDISSLENWLKSIPHELKGGFNFEK